MASQKKSPRQEIESCVNAIVTYQQTIIVGSKILAMPEVQKDLSTKVAQTALVEGAKERVLSEYNSVLRRISEHCDGIARKEGTIDATKLQNVAEHIFNFSATQQK